MFEFICQHETYKQLFEKFSHCPNYNSAFVSYDLSINEIKNNTVANKQSSALARKDRLLKELKIRTHAYRLKSVYGMCQQKLREGEIVAYTHMMRGFSTPKYQINESCSIEIKTNFGYGGSSYFYTRLRYKSIDILPYSEWVKYRIANQFEVVRYWKKYELHNIEWMRAMNECTEAINLSVQDIDKFLDEYIVSELEELASGLEKLLEGSQYFAPDGKRLYSDKNEYTERGYITTRGSKISGALRFISDIKKISEYLRVENFIERIEKCNLKLLPVLNTETSLIKAEISNNRSKYELVKEREIELKDKYIYFSDIIKVITHICTNCEVDVNLLEAVSEVLPDCFQVIEEYEEILINLRSLEAEYDHLYRLQTQIASYVDVIETYFTPVKAA